MGKNNRIRLGAIGKERTVGKWEPPNRKRLVSDRKNYLVPEEVDFGVIQVTGSKRSRVVMLRFRRHNDPTPVHLIFNPRLFVKILRDLWRAMDESFEFGAVPDIDVAAALEEETERLEQEAMAAEIRAKARLEKAAPVPPDETT